MQDGSCNDVTMATLLDPAPSGINEIYPFGTSQSETEAPDRNTNCAHITFTLLIGLLGVDDILFKQKLGKSVLIKTKNSSCSKTVTICMAMAQRVSFCGFCNVFFWCQVCRTMDKYS